MPAMNFAPAGRAGRLVAACPCCDPGTLETRRRKRLIDLVSLLDHPDALPPDLALRLGVELLALAEEGTPTFSCEAIGEIRP